MPFINVIRGEQIPDAPLNVRTPILRVPIWLMVLWWTVKALVRLAGWAARRWYLTVPGLALGWLWLRYGWLGPMVVLLVVGVGLSGWRLCHRPSFVRWVWFPAWGWWRRVVYRRGWVAAMATAKLVTTFDSRMIVPVLRTVTTDGVADLLTIRMVSGQIPDDYARAGERLMHTFGARAVRVLPGRRPDQVRVRLLRRDPLAHPVALLPVPAVPDFTGLPVALLEDGTVYRLRLFGTQVLIVGATGSGKGSVLWSIVAALAGGIHTGLVRVWGFDPKGGMEMAPGQALLDRFFCDDYPAMADAFEAAVAVMRDRQARLRGRTRQHIPTVAEPLYLLLIDELAALTAYLTDRAVRDRIKAALSVLLTQGRAVGVHVVAAVQDPRKEILSFRDLFPTRIALRLTEPVHVDLVLGEGARDRGALCDRIPVSLPGLAYVVLEGVPTPVRGRFAFWSDTDIGALGAAFAPPGPTRRGSP